MLNVAPQKERIPDHLRAMAEQDDKSAASGKTGEQSSIGVGCAPGEERDSAISICAVHSTTVTAAIAEFCEGTVEKQKTLTEVLDGLVDLTTRLASLATARRSAIVEGVVVTATENLGKARADVQWWNSKDGTGDSTGEWFPAWFDPAVDGREVFHHTRPATARGMVWAHVERRDMVAAFDWKPSAAGRYKVPPAIKRWLTG